MFNLLQPHELQYTRLPFIISWILLKLMSIELVCFPTSSSSVISFPSCSQAFPSSGYFLMSQFLTSCGQKIGASATALGLLVIFRVDVLQDWLVWSPCCPRDSQEYSPAPQFTPARQLKGINYLVLSLLLEKAVAPHSSTLAWKIPWMEEPGGLQSMGSLRVGHNWATSLSLFTFMHWRRNWQPTPVSLPGESQGRGSLVGCRQWGHTELDMTEAT